MERDEEVRAAVVDCIREFAETHSAISNYLLGAPLVSAGFTELEIADALLALNDAGVVELLEGNRVRLLETPACREARPSH